MPAIEEEAQMSKFGLGALAIAFSLWAIALFLIFWAASRIL
jgi:hypothetical protein